MTLHLNQNLFKEAVQFTAQKMNIPEIYVEKDYWVCLALHTIFKNNIGKDTVFKGGTALSKCYNLIERFSEDIDLVVLRREGESNNQLTNKIKEISKVVNAVLPEIEIAEITHKMGMNRKTAHSYTKEFQGNFGQIRDVIIIEATWLGYFEPYSSKNIVSFIGEMMIENKQVEIAEQYDLQSFECLVLEPIRTLCEKIMSLIRFSYSENPLDDLKKKIRHIYDLHQLLQQNEFQTFFNSSDFDSMLLKVANDDLLSFKSNNLWLENHPSNAMIFNDLDQIWIQLKPIYLNDFRNLVYGNLPKDELIFSTLNAIKDRLETVIWTIKI